MDTGDDLPDDEDSKRPHRELFLPHEDDQEDVDAIVENIKARFARASQAEYEEDAEKEATEVEQQALLPSVRDPKLWMVKCAV